MRPIACGEVLRRIASAALLKAFCPRNAQRQFVNRRDGCLTVAELVRASIKCGAARSIVQIDMRNAFNTIERDVFLEQAASLPAARMCFWAYQKPYNLRWKGQCLLSTRGVAQGDPLGTWLFSLGLESLIALSEK